MCSSAQQTIPPQPTRLGIYMRTAIRALDHTASPTGDCKICATPLTAAKTEQPRRLARLPCDHEYHIDCLMAWWRIEAEETETACVLEWEPGREFRDINPYALYCQTCDFRFTPNEKSWAHRDDLVPPEMGATVVEYFKFNSAHLSSRTAGSDEERFKIHAHQVHVDASTMTREMLRLLNARAGESANPFQLVNELAGAGVATSQTLGPAQWNAARREARRLVTGSMRKSRWAAVLEDEEWAEELDKAARLARMVVRSDGTWVAM